MKRRQTRMASLIAKREGGEGVPKRRRETATPLPSSKAMHGRSTALPAPSTALRRRALPTIRGRGGGRTPIDDGPFDARSGEDKMVSVVAACGLLGNGRRLCTAIHGVITGRGLGRTKVCPSTASC